MQDIIIPNMSDVISGMYPSIDVANSLRSVQILWDTAKEATPSSLLAFALTKTQFSNTAISLDSNPGFDVSDEVYHRVGRAIAVAHLALRASGHPDSTQRHNPKLYNRGSILTPFQAIVDLSRENARGIEIASQVKTNPSPFWRSICTNTIPLSELIGAQFTGYREHPEKLETTVANQMLYLRAKRLIAPLPIQSVDLDQVLTKLATNKLSFQNQDWN